MKVLENNSMGDRSTLLPTHSMDGLTAIAGCDLNATDTGVNAFLETVEERHLKQLHHTATTNNSNAVNNEGVIMYEGSGFMYTCMIEYYQVTPAKKTATAEGGK